MRASSSEKWMEGDREMDLLIRVMEAAARTATLWAMDDDARRQLDDLRLPTRLPILAQACLTCLHLPRSSGVALVESQARRAFTFSHQKSLPVHQINQFDRVAFFLSISPARHPVCKYHISTAPTTIASFN